MANIRRRSALWSNASTGAAGTSTAASIGAAVNVTLFIQVDGATTITIEASPGTGGAGRNDDISSSANWYPLFKDDFAAGFSFAFAGAGKAALDLSPLAAEHIRLVSSNNVTATAYADAI